jgi:glutamyl-Q tRNA(Asp) synthetase
LLTRFAPAPTGWLHLGHVLNAEYVWGELGPPSLEERRRVILRIEDHDRERCRPEFEAGILEDLAWLGYQPDSPLVRQSDRHAIYSHAAQRLIDRGLVYACDCTRKMVDSKYSGRCRERALVLTDAIGWRVRIDPGVETFDDLLLGPQAQDPSQQCGDVLIRDRLGNWTYQFAASVDDHDQGIDLVIRGEDLLASTGRQIRIARLLGRQTPATFLHHPLLMKSPGQKLSKSDGDTGIRALRARGWTPDAVKSAARSARLL